MLVDNKTALMSESEFKELPEYSYSAPTLTTIGKRWKRRYPYAHNLAEPTQWFMGEYVEKDPPDPNMVMIHFREIILV